MNGKISFHQLAEKAAEISGIPVQQTEEFLKSLFEAASVALENGEDVMIEGIGTFHLSDESENPVMLIPDGDLAKAVNAPFDMFEPQILAAPESEINSIKDEALTSHVADIRTGEEVATPCDSPSVKSDELTGKEDVKTDESGILPPVHSTEQELSVPLSNSSVPVATPPPHTPSGKQDIPPAIKSTQSSVSLPSFPEEETPATEYNEEDKMPENAKPKKSGFGTGFFIGLLCGIAIGALGMFIVFLISTRMYSSETLYDSQNDLELTQEALFSLSGDE